MLDLLDYILSGFIMGVSCYYIWNKFLGIKHKIFSIKFILTLLFFSIALVLNYHFSGSYYKVIIVIILFILTLRLFHIKDLKKAIIVSIVSEIIFFIAELLFSVIMLIILQNNIEFAIDKYFGSALTNFIICFIAVILSQFRIFKKLYFRSLEITNKIKISNILFIFAILIVSFNIFLMLPYYKVDTVHVVLLNSLMIIIYSFIVFKFIEQKKRYVDISDKYSLTESSLKELQSNVNRLMTINHENKNQLLTIRTMIANKDKNVLKSLDALIEEKVKEDKELKTKTSVIANTMLGALIYSKMLTMKEKEIKYNLHIDKALSKVDFINLGDKTNIDVCKIVGVYLDNAIEAVCEISIKEVSIELYLDEDFLFISISNPFEGEVNVNLIDNYGYTTKKTGHGYGLSLVKEVIKDNSQLSSETEIIDNVFMQKLKIKM